MSVLETHDGNLESQVEHRSEEVWFEDGNIVLRAQDVLFRVYKGILSRESPVFMDLFKLPQPEQQKEVHEESGCPVVEVQEKAEDMEMFLTVLLDSKTLYEKCSLRQLIILLDMGWKYQVNSFLRRVMPAMDHFFPDTLVGHDHWRGGCQDPCPSFSPDDPLQCDGTTDENIRLMIQTARRTGLTIFIPAAFLWLATSSVEYILSLAHEGWTQSDLNTVVIGQRELHYLARDDVFLPLFSSHRDMSDDCRSPAACHQRRHEIIDHVQSIEEYSTADPFHKLDMTKGAPSKLCSSCRIVVEEAYLTGREKAWNELPEQFGLPSWDDLRKARDDLLADVQVP